jgi:hypothetical protein
MSLLDEARVFARLYPTSASHPTGGDDNWDQDCGRLCYRFADRLGWDERPDESAVHSAYAVAMASGRLDRDPRRAPAGAWHFWDIAGPANGHVGIDIAGGGHSVFMGTYSVREDWGLEFVGRRTGIGLLSVAGYTDAKAGRATYLGWATNYAGGTLDRALLAALTTEPITKRKDPDLMAQRQYYARVRMVDGKPVDDGEWMLEGVDIPPHPERPLEDGYRITKDKALARRWARQYGPNPATTAAVHLERADYIAQQAFARADAAEWRAAMRALLA